MPAPGSPHPQFPGCLYNSLRGTYVCDDGFDIDGNPIEQLDYEIALQEGAVQSAGLRQQLAAGAYRQNQDNSSVQIRELGQVGINDLSSIIRGAGGAFITSASDPLVASARGQWWRFSVEISTDGSQARISENKYLLYGGIGIGVVIAVSWLANK